MELRLDNRVLRLVLSKVFPLDSEFDAFVLDSFPDAHQLFGQGMDRVAKVNLLFQKYSPEIVSRFLWEHYRNPMTASVESLLNQSLSLENPAQKHVNQLRLWIIKVCLATLAINFVFYIVAPVIGFPLEYEQAFRLLEVILPVFLGYLGAATGYLFARRIAPAPHLKSTEILPILQMLVFGPLVVFLLVSMAGLIAYGISNRQGASLGIGITPNQLAAYASIALSILTVSSNTVIAYLFSGD